MQIFSVPLGTRFNALMDSFQMHVEALMDKAVRAPMSANESVSVSVRRIDNGYVLRKSRSTDQGYSETETFSKERPMLEADSAPKMAPDPGQELMRAAVKAASK